MFVFRWACCSWWVGGFFYVARMMMRKQWQRAKFQKGTPVGLYSERPLISLLLATPQPLSVSWKSASLCKLLSSPIIMHYPPPHMDMSHFDLCFLLLFFLFSSFRFPRGQWHACLSAFKISILLELYYIHIYVITQKLIKSAKRFCYISTVAISCLFLVKAQYLKMSRVLCDICMCWWQFCPRGPHFR